MSEMTVFEHWYWLRYGDHTNYNSRDVARNAWEQVEKLMDIELLRKKKSLELALKALDFYASNPELWDFKGEDEWYALPAKEALKAIKELNLN